MTRILIIDDSLFQRRIISSILVKGGFQVSEASNGKEGLEHVLEDKPDLILVDLLMPEMDGFEFLRRLLSEQNTIPIIVMTSDVQDSTRNECMNLGASAFVNKPVQGETLIPTIRNHIPSIS